jgi:hypothetical protein
MKRERRGMERERERSGITSLRELPDGKFDEGKKSRDLFWESGICGHDNFDNESVGS